MILETGKFSSAKTWGLYEVLSNNFLNYDLSCLLPFELITANFLFIDNSSEEVNKRIMIIDGL